METGTFEAPEKLGHQHQAVLKEGYIAISRFEVDFWKLSLDRTYHIHQTAVRTAADCSWSDCSLVRNSADSVPLLAAGLVDKQDQLEEHVRTLDIVVRAVRQPIPETGIKRMRIRSFEQTREECK